MPTDQRKVIGGRVQAKALHVSNLAECSRRYGANKGTKVVFGTVVDVIHVVNPATNRTSTFIVAVYDLGGGTMKETRLNVRSVKAAPPPPTNATEVPTAPVADDTTTTTTTTTPPEIDLPAPASPPTAPPPTAPASPPTAPSASPLLMTPVASPLPEEGAPLVLGAPSYC
jgi:hypothetical protein